MPMDRPRRRDKDISTHSKVRINSTKKSIPHIINLSVQGVKAPIFVKALEEEGIAFPLNRLVPLPIHHQGLYMQLLGS